jgi:peptide deformylase
VADSTFIEADTQPNAAPEPELEARVGTEREAGVEPEREAGVEPRGEAGAGLVLEAGHEAEREEVELDPETAARRDAALAQIRSFGDPVLRTRARPIDRFDDALRQEVARMGALMDDALGVGLAATQVGVVHRLLVYRVQQQAPLAALINPEVEWTGRESESLEEGCLSLPGVLVEVDRPIHVRVRALDEFGKPILIEASGLEARVIQHEIDHLDGKLILDRTSRDQRKEAMRVLRERQQAA